MTDKILWTIPNAVPGLIESLRRGCAVDNGTLLTNDNGNGTFTAVCMALTSPAVPAVAAGGAPTSTASGAVVASAQPQETLAAAITTAAATNVSPDKRFNDLTHLHPAVRKRVSGVQRQLDAENIPMKVFEAFRTPQRQAKLFAQGRTATGKKVTNANAWESYHQYGLAADFVRFENNKWNWSADTAQQRREWDRFHKIAISNGLEPLNWELPHVQMIGITLTELMNGDYPNGGDQSWSDNLTKFIAGWAGLKKPPLPSTNDRPAFPSPMVGLLSAGGITSSTWYSMFGGDSWTYDKKGVYTRDHTGRLKLWRTSGAPITTQEILAKLGPQIHAASQKHEVAPELIVMTIATETAAFRIDGFTGPRTYRWEKSYTVGATGDPAIDGKEKGDYSAGPMQVMADTARWMNNVVGLGYDNNSQFAFFKNKPSKTPTDLGLYNIDVCIDIGTSYIRHQMPTTSGNPLLVAAAYNSGNLRASSQNQWRIRSHGNHIDRAAEWYSDACFVLYG
ncbi:D-alanyl-D-alanine carboxypeptidase family protein [Salipiger bermudensis]|uniref:D-alanyl-D-alanine carboxypeptidase family protein n=1 Tax=Salipiger bermudensis TaxID=344736 RepID=UPI001C99B413|nr:D-alanyl-D-alanine carboxypeptidase family protein [Salipiger bermudensis]MBY6005026.1 D-alanyl-D-alanine carboxypeptidase family protein [Salipiger bermudensis]